MQMDIERSFSLETEVLIQMGVGGPVLLSGFPIDFQLEYNGFMCLVMGKVVVNPF